MPIEAVGEPKIEILDPERQIVKEGFSVDLLNEITLEDNRLSIEFRPELGGIALDISLEPEDQIRFSGRRDALQLLNVYSTAQGKVTAELLILNGQTFGTFPAGTFLFEEN